MEMLSLESYSTFNLQSYSHSRLQNVGRTGKAVFSKGNCRNQQLQFCGIQTLQSRRRSSHQARLPTFRISCDSHNGGCTVSEVDTCNAEGTLVLKSKAEEVSLGLNGKSIFLVGMMGCGKTTVGKILSEALGYYFLDSDKLIEESAGGTPVAQIFKENNEEYFRDSESKVLSELSSMHHLVVATGGGAVVRPQNWRYLNQGVTIWLDVPLEALAKRVIAVGTESRPLLGQASVDPYSQESHLYYVFMAFCRLLQGSLNLLSVDVKHMPIQM